MPCNCFEIVNKKLCDKLDDPTGSLNTMWLRAGNKVEEKPAITFVYTKRNEDGSRQEKKSEIVVAYEFCPFCGKKYEEE